MAIYDALRALMGQGREDPVEEMKRRILLASTAGGGQPQLQPQPAPEPQPQPQPQPQPEPPKPAVEAAVAEQPAAAPAEPPVPEAYKSPPDLASMYMEHLERARRQQNTNDALTMIAAGLTGEQDTREALLGTIGRGGGGETGLSSAIQETMKAQQAALTKQKMQAMLPTLSKQLNVPIEQLQTMLEGGTLEEFVKTMADPQTNVVDGPRGQKLLIDSNTGKIKSEITPSGPREIIYRKDSEGNDVPVYKDDDTRVDTGDPMGVVKEERKITYEDGPRGRKLAIDQDGKRVQDMDIPGEDEIIVEKNAEGQFQAINKTTGKPVGDPFGSKEDNSTPEMKNYAAEAAAAKARGETIDPYDVWSQKRRVLESPQGGANYDPRTGTTFPAPEPGKQWKRDKNGAIMTDENGAGIQVTTPGTKQAAEEEAAAKAANNKRSQKLIASSILINDADRALQIAAENKDSFFKQTTGLIGTLASSLPGTPAHSVFTSLQSVKAQIGFDKLQQMRDASPTGAALGPVSDFENRLLQATYGSLEQSQDYDQFVHNLERVKKIYAAVVNAEFGEGTPEEINASPLAKELGLSMDAKGNATVQPAKIKKKKSADEIMKELEGGESGG